MKKSFFLTVAISAIVLSGCSGSGSGSPGGGGGGGGTPPPQTIEIMYAINGEHVTSFKINTQSGALTQQQDITLSTNGVPILGVLDHVGHFLYLADSGTGANYPLIAAYSLDSSGNMTALSGSPFTVGNVGGTYAYALAVSPNGQYFYLTDGNSYLGSAKINSDGSLTAVSNTYLAPDTTVNSMVVGSSGNYLYMSSAFGGVVTVQLNADGSMSEMTGSPFDMIANSTPTDIFLAPSGNFLYTVLPNAPGGGLGSIQVDSITANGTPLAVSGSPFPTGVFPLTLAIDPIGDFAYLSELDNSRSQATNQMAGFSVSRATGDFASLSGFNDDYLLNTNMTLTGFSAVGVDPSGSYLYAAVGTATPTLVYSQGVMGYSINASSGLVTPLNGFPITESRIASHFMFDQFQ